MSFLSGLNTKCLRKGDPEPEPLTPGKVRLYSMRFCPWSERVVLYMAFKQIEAEVINIDLAEKPEWYFKKHPEGNVPLLEIDGDIIVESGLIPEYLDDRFSVNRILPIEPYAKYHQKLLVEQLSSVAPLFYGFAQALKDPSILEEKNAAMRVVFSKAEALLKNEYFGGSTLGFADLLLFPFFERFFWLAASGRCSLDGSTFPGEEYSKLGKWYTSIFEHHLVKDALQPLEAAEEFISGHENGKMNCDAGL